MIYFNQLLSQQEIQKTRDWTCQLINTAVALGGSYYLTYQNFASHEAFKRAYPGYTTIIKIKQHYDPEHLFINKFYQTYF